MSGVARCMIPAALGPFALTALLGEGGSSFVYAASRDGVELALKVLRPELGLDEREQRRFVEEAQRLRALAHPNLVSVIDAGVLPDGRPFLAMPRLVGRSVAERIAEAGRVGVGRALDLFTGLAGATAALHQAGLVHRDIKPENVLWLDVEDQLVLLDLGIARGVDEAASTTTRAGLARGTPAYMAPERFFGRPADVASDVYELALVFYVLVVGRLPWDPTDPKARIAPEPPSRHGVLVPPNLSEVLLQALSIDVERRPPSAEALLGGLREAWLDAQRGADEAALGNAPTVAHRLPQSELGFAPTTAALTPAQPALPPVGPSTTAVSVATASVGPPRASLSTPAALALGAGLAVLLLVGLVGGGGYLLWRSAGERSLAVRYDPGADEVVVELEPSARVAPTSPRAVASADAPPPGPSTGEPSGRAPAPRTTTTGAAVPTTPPPTASSAAMAPPSPAGMTPACAAFVAEICAPRSGGDASDCARAREDAARWGHNLPPQYAAETCQKTLGTRLAEIAKRRAR